MEVERHTPHERISALLLCANRRRRCQKRNESRHARNALVPDAFEVRPLMQRTLLRRKVCKRSNVSVFVAKAQTRIMRIIDFEASCSEHFGIMPIDSAGAVKIGIVHA